MRSRGLRIATVGGVPVYIGSSWLLLAGLVLLLLGPDLAERYGASLGYPLAGLYAVGLLLCVLAHEGAHAWAARRHGYPVHRVVADLWGGHTAFEAARGTPLATALIALSGPAANLLIAALAFAAHLVLPGGGVLSGVVWVLAMANLLLALFNLLPGLPLDGGQVVESLVWGITGDQGRARVVAGWCGRVLVLGLLLLAALPALTGRASLNLGSLLWTVMIASFLWAGASGAIASGRSLQALGRVDLGGLIEPASPVPAAAPVSRLLQATALPVVVDEHGAPVGLVDHAAVRAVPADRVDQTPVSAVTAHLPAGWSAELGGTTPVLDLVRAFQTSGSGVAAVTQGRLLQGVVRAERLDAALRRR